MAGEAVPCEARYHTLRALSHHYTQLPFNESVDTVMDNVECGEAVEYVMRGTAAHMLSRLSKCFTIYLSGQYGR